MHVRNVPIMHKINDDPRTVCKFKNILLWFVLYLLISIYFCTKQVFL